VRLTCLRRTSGVSFGWCSITLGVAIVFSMSGAADASDKKNVESLTVDLRAAQFDNDNLRLFGSGTSQFVKPTKEGLAISAPQDKQVKELGFGPKFTLRGDFEITAGFEITKLDDPDGGYGVGPSLHIATSSPAADAATVSRLKRVKEGDVFSTHSATNVAQSDGKPKRKHSVKMFDTTAMTGRLRLVRAGKTLRYLVSEGGPEAEFRELKQIEFTDADVTLVRVSLNRNGAGTPAEMRWLDFAVTAKAFVGKGQSWTAVVASVWPWVAMASGLVLLVVVVWLWRRRQAG